MALKAVLLEGLEVVFIVIAVGAGDGLLVPASIGAIAAHAMGLPVLRALYLCTCCRRYPGAATAPLFAHPPRRVSLPRKGDANEN